MEKIERGKNGFRRSNILYNFPIVDNKMND